MPVMCLAWPLNRGPHRPVPHPRSRMSKPPGCLRQFRLQCLIENVRCFVFQAIDQFMVEFICVFIEQSGYIFVPVLLISIRTAHGGDVIFGHAELGIQFDCGPERLDRGVGFIELDQCLSATIMAFIIVRVDGDGRVELFQGILVVVPGREICAPGCNAGWQGWAVARRICGNAARIR